MPDMKKLKGQLTEKEVSVETLANRIGVDPSTVYRWLASNGENIPLKAAITINKVLDLEPEMILNIFFKD